LIVVSWRSSWNSAFVKVKKIVWSPWKHLNAEVLNQRFAGDTRLCPETFLVIATGEWILLTFKGQRLPSILQCTRTASHSPQMSLVKRILVYRTNQRESWLLFKSLPRVLRHSGGCVGSSG
jgi:hypothetical protein